MDFVIRGAFLFAAVLAVVAPPQSTADPVSLAQAFRAGNTDQYKNRQVKGTGVNFHGALTERLADGTTRTSLVITVGSAPDNSTAVPIRTWQEFVAAERAHTTLVVALSGANLPPPPSGAGPQVYEFSGIYDGQVRTVLRLPLPPSKDTALPPPVDMGPCKGESAAPAQIDAQVSFYCAPLLVNATATIKQ
jgi:hypothetical protein